MKPRIKQIKQIFNPKRIITPPLAEEWGESMEFVKSVVTYLENQNY